MIINEAYTSVTVPSVRSSVMYTVGCVIEMPDGSGVKRNVYLRRTANDILAAVAECPVLELCGLPSFTAINAKGISAWLSGDSTAGHKYRTSDAELTVAVTIQAEIRIPLTSQTVEFHIAPLISAISAACFFRIHDARRPPRANSAKVIFGKTGGKLSIVQYGFPDMREVSSDTERTIRATTAVLHSAGVLDESYMASRMTLDTAADFVHCMLMTIWYGHVPFRAAVLTQADGFPDTAPARKCKLMRMWARPDGTIEHEDTGTDCQYGKSAARFIYAHMNTAKDRFGHFRTFHDRIYIVSDSGIITYQGAADIFAQYMDIQAPDGGNDEYTALDLSELTGVDPHSDQMGQMLSSIRSIYENYSA